MYNFQIQNKHIVFPVMTDAQNQEDREIISIFLYYYRDVGVMRAEGRVLSAIQKASILTGNSEGVITKILVENGLRASRRSLPQEFLDFVDHLALQRQGQVTTPLPSYYEDLRSFWIDCGENPLSFLSSLQERQMNISSFVTT